MNLRLTDMLANVYPIEIMPVVSLWMRTTHQARPRRDSSPIAGQAGWADGGTAPKTLGLYHIAHAANNNNTHKINGHAFCSKTT